MVNNLDWTKNLAVIGFLRDIGKHFSMTPLVQRDYIAKRIGNEGAGISYAEFSYTLLQGMDYLHLYDRYGVTLQLGGSDQWGNCLSGVELIRKARGKEAHVITLPLVINKATGKKFGKSEEGAVWLDAQKTSPTQFYQFWINADDEGLDGYLKIFTELSKGDITELLSKHRKQPKERHAQRALAEAVTTLVHGAQEAEQARLVTDVLTGQTSIGAVSKKVIKHMRKEVPHTKVKAGEAVTDVLVKTGLASSKTEARRLLEGNAVAINNQKTTKDKLEKADFQEGRLLLRKGKAFKDSAFVELA
jgi:tyrosyl-tRNA synthetase